MRLPRSRGPLSDLVSGLLTTVPSSGAIHGEVDRALAAVAGPLSRVTDPLGDADLQLALAVCYELHYRGFSDVAGQLEWHPVVLAVRRELEAVFEAALARVRPPADLVGRPVDQGLRTLVDNDAGPSLSPYLMREATLEQFREFVRQRSIYQLREADPHTWAIPRLAGPAKAALVEIQADEYGGGRPGRMHAELFAATMRELGLDDTYGAYWSGATAQTLAMVNLMSLLGLHRRHRGALCGQLAALEMTSTAPNRRYANGLRRLGFGPAATTYFDEHVEADAVHEQLAAVDLCGSLVSMEPDRTADVLWGAACGLALDGLAAEALLVAWGAPTQQECA